jgi:ArsR family transcriptional regulator, lead/cadmium/zinc/bismuth-responsive transcriptional repressor
MKPLPYAIPNLGDEQIAEISEILRLLGEPSRLRILLACLAAPASVGEIAQRVAIPRSLIRTTVVVLGIAGCAGSVPPDPPAPKPAREDANSSTVPAPWPAAVTTTAAPPSSAPLPKPALASRLLRADRNGKQIIYSPVDDRVRCIVADLASHVVDTPENKDES